MLPRLVVFVMLLSVSASVVFVAWFMVGKRAILSRARKFRPGLPMNNGSFDEMEVSEVSIVGAYDEPGDWIRPHMCGWLLVQSRQFPPHPT